MTVIYVDTLFLLNALVDYLLLLCSARLAGEPLRRLRFALGAALGGGVVEKKKLIHTQDTSTTGIKWGK